MFGCGRLVTPDSAEPGWLRVREGMIVAAGAGAAPGPVAVDLGRYTVVPGFVDLHVHGGGGADYSDGIAESVGRVAAHHLHLGTTTTLASLVSAAPDELPGLVGLLAEATRDGVIAGIHLEGPWLSARRAGAHRTALLRDPEPTELERVLTAGAGTIRMVTLAPERTGALDAIQRIRDAGALAAIGHTDADYARVRAAVDAGARVATHLFNAMRPVHHREPGPVVALLEDERVTVELILDGVHVHPALYRQVLAGVGPDRLALVSDAMAAAGCADGSYRLGATVVSVRDGRATLESSATIAGSTACMAELFANAVRFSGLPEPRALCVAAALTSATPAAALGRTDIGALRPGGRADLVVLDAELRPAAVLRCGEWVTGPPVG